MATDEASVCRFCFSSSNPLIDIFDESETNILEIITEHIGEANRSDTMPKYICTECWRKIEEFHHFHRSILTAQKNYLKRMVKLETESASNGGSHGTTRLPNFIEVITNSDEYNAFANDTMKSTNELDNDDDDNIQHEIKHYELDDFCNDTTPYMDDAMVAMEEDEEIEDGEDTECVSASSKSNDHLDSATRRKIFIQNFDTTCDICSVDMRSMKGAISHYRNKHDIEDGYIKCCGLKLKQDKLVDDHIRYHINPEIFKCRYCDRNMKTKHSLAVHIAKHRHKGEFTCDICGKIYGRLDHIKVHMVTHSREKLCPICKKAFTDQQKLKSHLKSHQNSDELDKQLKQTTQMRKTKFHAMEIEAVIAEHFNMKCDHCDTVFKSLQEAQFHYMNDHLIADGYIQCCDLKIKTIKDIERHVLYHLRPELFVCCVCEREYTKVDKLQAHLNGHKNDIKTEQGKNTCTICNKRYADLRTHSRKIHGLVVPARLINLNAIAPDPNSMKEFFDMHCDVCKLQLSSLQHAKLHYLEEHNIPDGYIKCCKMKFKDLKNINEHLLYHMNPKTFECDICSKVFQRKKDLSTHTTYHRAVATKKFSCDECGKVLRSQYYLNVHKIKHQDKATRLHSCNQCDRTFTAERYLKIHIRLRHDKNPTAMCEFCGKQFPSRIGVLSHTRNVHQAGNDSISQKDPVERSQCTICSASFINKFRLKTHIQNVHEAKPVKCSQCDKVAPNEAALACHMKAVHVASSHQCHLCPKSFKAAVALKDHIATHTGEKTYKCSFCPEAFIWRPNMYTHQKKAHPDEWKLLKTQQRK